MSDDLTVHILTEIRDEIRGTNQRLDQTRVDLRAEIGELRTELRAEIGELRTGLRAEIGELRTGLRAELRTEIGSVRQEIGSLRDEIGEVRSHLVSAELRLATRFVELTAANRDVHQLFEDRFELRDRVERVEHEVAELKKRGEPQS